MSATKLLGRCVSCTAGNHSECDGAGSSMPCVCCPQATVKSAARRLNDGLFGATNNQGEDAMTTTTKKTDARQAPDAEKAKAVTKRAARPNITAAKKATPAKATAKKAAPKADAPQSVIEPVAPKPEVPKAEAPKAEKFDACPLCGFHFTKPQVKCNSVTACERRQNGKAPRGTTSNGNGSEHSKTSTITAMNAERQAMKDWTAGGEQGDRPATPLLDKIRADYAAKEAAKAEAAAARKAEVTPILKAVK